MALISSERKHRDTAHLRTTARQAEMTYELETFAQRPAKWTLICRALYSRAGTEAMHRILG